MQLNENMEYKKLSSKNTPHFEQLFPSDLLIPHPLSIDLFDMSLLY